MNNSKIKLIEVMNTFQGEGPDSGRQMLLVRFKRCQFRCNFCDTEIKMQTSIEGEYSTDQINQALMKTKGLMVTGGEPGFDSEDNKNFQQTMYLLKECNFEVANVETNGLQIEQFLSEIEQFVSDKNIKLIYSPKIFNIASLETEWQKIEKVINNPRVYLKIVPVNLPTETLCRRISTILDIPKHKVYLMPQGTTKEEIVSNWDKTINLADECGFNLSSRLHIVHNFT